MMSGATDAIRIVPYFVLPQFLLLFDLSRQCFFRCCDRIRDSCRVLTAGLSHIRTSAAATANFCCDRFDQVTCMCTLLHSSFCCHSDQTYFAFVCRCQYNNTLAEFLFQLITQVTQSVHIYIFQSGCQKFYSVDFFYTIHDIAKCILCSFTL